MTAERIDCNRVRVGTGLLEKAAYLASLGVLCCCECSVVSDPS